MLTFSAALDQIAYESLRYTIIKNAEGIEYRLYVDSVGIPTIGIGFGLHDELKIILT